MNILYVLPARGSSGGSNSVYQEVKALMKLGVNAKIAVNDKNYESFLVSYASDTSLSGIVVSYDSSRKLAEYLNKCDVAIATIGSTVPFFLKAVSFCTKKPKLAYYIQDYEPLFSMPGSEAYESAFDSYNHGDILNGFAKTDWICKVVGANHNMVVTKVEPSIDHNVYFPSGSNKFRKTICAMVRPSTPRRAPFRTVRILNKLADHYAKEGIKLICFGSEEYEFRRAGLILDTNIESMGRLTREQVGQLLRTTDLFLDLSDYQAFGRTGLEAMACGVIPILPMFGGSYEYIKHNENGFAIDVRSDKVILEQIAAFWKLNSKKRALMVNSALATAAEYSCHKAAVSIRNFLTSL